MDYLIIMLRTLFISFIIFFVLGKKEKHHLSILDLVLFIMVAQMAVNAIQDINRPLMETVLPISLLLLIQLLFTRFFQRKEKWRKSRSHSEEESLHIKQKSEATFQGDLPIPLIIDGKVQEEQLQKINQTSLWIRQQMRKLGYRDIKQISYCALKGQHTFFVDAKEEKW